MKILEKRVKALQCFSMTLVLLTAILVIAQELDLNFRWLKIFVHVWLPTKTLAKCYVSGPSADLSVSGASPEADEAVLSALSSRSVSLALGSMPTC